MKFKPFLKCRAATSTDARILIRYAGESVGETRANIRSAYWRQKIDKESKDTLLGALAYEIERFDADDWVGGVEGPQKGWSQVGEGCRMKTARL